MRATDPDAPEKAALAAELAALVGPAFAPRAERAIWLQIHDRLGAALGDGRLPPGARLPSENTLARLFGVTRATLRRALARLQQEGALQARKGVGIFVRPLAPRYVVDSNLRFSEALLAQGRALSTRTLALERAAADAAAAAALGLAAGTPLWRLVRLRLLDGAPLYLADKVFPAERFPRFEAAYGARQSVQDVYAAHGIARYRRRVTRISGGFATRAEAEALGLTPRTPLLLQVSINADEAGCPIEFSRGRWPLNGVEIVLRPDEGGAAPDSED
jgi:phosphonate metabolism transcriptional regulator PhnF